MIKKQEFIRMYEQNESIKALQESSVLITGATGMIATSCIEFLNWLNVEHKYNIKIIAIVRDFKKAKLKFEKLNIKDISILEKDVSEGVPNIETENIDYVIHAASNAHPKAYIENPVETMKANIMGTINYLEHFKDRNIKNFLYVSSSEVYGENKSSGPIKEEYLGTVDQMKLRSSYTESKRAAETLCIAYSNQYNVKTTIARLGYIFGPNFNVDNSRADTDFLIKALKSQDLVLKSTGEQQRSYLYVQDSVTAIFSILISGENQQAYNVGSNEPISLFKFAKIISKLANVGLSIETENDENVRRNSNSVMNSVLDNAKLKKIGWNQSFTVEEGIANILKIKMEDQI